MIKEKYDFFQDLEKYILVIELIILTKSLILKSIFIVFIQIYSDK